MLKMLRYTHGQMLQQQHYLSWNAHFESCAVHARNLVDFLSNGGDTRNFKAREFARDYQARKGDLQGPINKLNEQVFHLAKKRPRAVVGKFNTEHAQEVRDWIEKNFDDFLNQLGEERRLFNDKKADPTHEEAVFITTSPNGPHQYACTASLAMQTSTTANPLNWEQR
jgi:hypothetical protein